MKPVIQIVSLMIFLFSIYFCYKCLQRIPLLETNNVEAQLKLLKSVINISAELYGTNANCRIHAVTALL